MVCHKRSIWNGWSDNLICKSLWVLGEDMLGMILGHKHQDLYDLSSQLMTPQYSGNAFPCQSSDLNTRADLVTSQPCYVQNVPITSLSSLLLPSVHGNSWPTPSGRHSNAASAEILSTFSLWSLSPMASMKLHDGYGLGSLSPTCDHVFSLGIMALGH